MSHVEHICVVIARDDRKIISVNAHMVMEQLSPQLSQESIIGDECKRTKYYFSSFLIKSVRFTYLPGMTGNTTTLFLMMKSYVSPMHALELKVAASQVLLFLIIH